MFTPPSPRQFVPAKHDETTACVVKSQPRVLRTLVQISKHTKNKILSLRSILNLIKMEQKSH